MPSTSEGHIEGHEKKGEGVQRANVRRKNFFHSKKIHS